MPQIVISVISFFEWTRESSVFDFECFVSNIWS